MKKILLNIILILLLSFSLSAQEENEELLPDSTNTENILNEESSIQDPIIDEPTIEDVKAISDSVLFRDPIFGIDYTEKDLGNITDFEIINERDTLLYTRSYGDWWFGPSWHIFNSSYYLGNYDFALYSYQPVDEDNKRVEYITNANTSWFNLNVGFLTEWTPVRQVWGVGGLFRWEKLYIDSDHQPTDAVNRNFIFNTNVEFDYLTLSPYFKYKTPLEGFNILILADISYIMKYESSFFKVQKDGPSNIRNELKIDFEGDISYKVGLNFGIEYEYFLQDIQKIEFFNKLRIFKNTRVKFAPNAMIGINTSPILNNGGSYPVTFRAGFAFKFGPDKIKGDTIPYNPTPRYEYLAKFDPKIKVQFNGFLERESFASSELNAFEESQATAQVSEEPQLPSQNLRDKDDSQVAAALVEEEKPKIIFKKGDNRTFTYSSSESTSPDKKLREFLDEIGKWLKDNPNAEIRIVGHSDNVGNPAEIQKRSIDRATRAKNYIITKYPGINQRKILTTGEGARTPVADIYSASGRAKNRRIEITVVNG